MKHKVNVTFGGKIIGKGEVSEDGSIFSADIDENMIPEKFRSGFNPALHLSFAEESYEDVELVDVVSAYPEEWVRQNPQNRMIHVPAPWEPSEKGTFSS